MIALIAQPLGFSLPSGTPAAGRTSVSRATTVVAATTADGVAAATGWHAPALAKMKDTLSLLERPYASDMGGFDSFSMAGMTGTIDCFEAPGAPNVAWCSGLMMTGPEKARSALVAFCGPLTDVPHLVTSCSVSDAGVELYIDWRARADCGYDPALEPNGYPDPTDRSMFAQGSARKDFAAAYYTPGASTWRDEILALGTPAPPLSAEVTAALAAGPLLVDVMLPPTMEAAQAASDACASAVDRWLEWMTTAGEMGRELPAGAKQTQTYAKDTKIRANHFGFLLGRYKAAYGEQDGADLATADAGPLDEAYVGGGS